MDRIEQKIIDIIDQNAEKIIAFGDDIWHHAELGYQEHRTSEKFCEVLDELNLSYEKNLAVTGVKSYLKDKTESEVRIALMGEMDALPIADHVDADPETGAAHCCGHDAQITGVMGAALALTDPEIKAALGGNIVFFGVPSEEATTAPEVKDKMIEEGLVKYLGGKCELIRNGNVDDIDMTVGHHVKQGYSIANRTSMGFMEKYVTYHGTAAHPAYICNAVDAGAAASLAMHAVDVQREAINRWRYYNTHILHGFVKNGGNVANIVADKTELDYNIRAKTLEDMMDIAYRVDRAFKGAAVATGAGMEIKTVPGYMPVVPIKDEDWAFEIFDLIDPAHKKPVFHPGPDYLEGTTDYGDLSCIMPVMQFLTGGAGGVAHNKSFTREDLYEYYVVPAKCFALSAYRLLKDDAALAKQIIANNKPMMTKDEYLNMMESISKVETMDMVPVPKDLV